MDTKVQVTADKARSVIIKSESNPEFGHIRVEQTRMVLDDNGFARRKKLSALIAGTVEDLAGFGWGANQLVDGKIIVKESLTPFNKREPGRDYKIAGDSGIVCSIEEQPIYRKHFYTFSAKAEDETLEHDNGEAIQAAYAASKAQGAIEPSKEFDL